MVSVTNLFFKFIKKKVVTDILPDFFEFLPFLDHFDDELGGEGKRIEPQSWGGPFEDMKKSYAPDNVSPGSFIPCVAALILVKI